MQEPKLETLKIGVPTDLILINLQSQSFVPLDNHLRRLIYYELGNPTYLTTFAEEIVFKEQRLSKVSEHEVLVEFLEIFEQKKGLVMSCNLQAEKLVTYYHKMYQLAAEYTLVIKKYFF